MFVCGGSRLPSARDIFQKIVKVLIFGRFQLRFSNFKINENIDFSSRNLLPDASGRETFVFSAFSKSSCSVDLELGRSHVQTNRIESRLIQKYQSIHEINVKIIAM